MTNPFRGKVWSLLNLHLAGLAALCVLNLFLVVRLFVAWRASSADREEQIAQEQITYAQLREQTQRLSGLPIKVNEARSLAGGFYAERLPSNYSAILGRLGELSVRSGARLTGAGYTQTPAIAGLSELRIDAHMSGEYPAIMHFINDVERDRTFFLIDGLTLTGQQGGMVNLRLRMTTYLSGAPSGPVSGSIGESVDGSAAGEAAGGAASRPVVEGVR